MTDGTDGRLADDATPPEPRLGPYRGPVVVLALAAVAVVGALAISLVGAVRAPDDVSNSATVLGTFPIDPGAEGISAGPAAAQTDPDAATTAPEGLGTTPLANSSSVPEEPDGPSEPDGPEGSGSAAVLDTFDGDLAAWELVGGEWSVDGGALVVPEATDETPAFLLRRGDALGIGGEVGAPARAAGLVVGYADPGTYVVALAVPSLGGWRLEAVAEGEEVANASVPASSRAGTVAALVVRGDEVVLLVDGAEAGTVDAPEGLGARVGFVARGPAGAEWAAALESR